MMAFAASGPESKQMAVGGWVQGGNPGEHAGLDFMKRLGNDITFDIYAHLYFSDDDNSLGAYVGYYWNFYLKGVPKDLGRMGFYVGPTGGVGMWDEEYWLVDDHYDKNYWWRDEFGFAIRFGVTGGFQWEFPVIPVQLYIELNPVGEFQYISWEDEHVFDIKGMRNDYREDSGVHWKIPDFYLRVGLRFWF